MVVMVVTEMVVTEMAVTEIHEGENDCVSKRRVLAQSLNAATHVFDLASYLPCEAVAIFDYICSCVGDYVWCHVHLSTLAYRAGQSYRRLSDSNSPRWHVRTLS